MVGQRLHPLLAILAARREALRELEIRFLLERQEARTDRIRPADPTLDEALVLDLVQLRLEGTPLTTSATEIGLTAHGVPATPQQLQLFLEAPRRDLNAANRALARIRAELGEEAVVRASLTEGHLPEARFTWEPLSHLPSPDPRAGGTPALVRRHYVRPVPLDMRAAARAGWAAYPRSRMRTGGALVGAHVLSGEWRLNSDEHDCSPIHRRYYFLETQGGMYSGFITTASDGDGSCTARWNDDNSLRSPMGQELPLLPGRGEQSGGACGGGQKARPALPLPSRTGTASMAWCAPI